MKLNTQSYWQFLLWMRKYWLKYRWLNVLNLVLGAVSAVLGLSFVYLFKSAIDIATGAQGGDLVVILVCYVLFTIADRVIGFTNSWLSTMLSTKTGNDMRMSLFNTLMHSDWQQLQQHHSGELQSRITKDVDYLVGMTINTFPAIFTMLFQLVGAFAYLCVLDYRLALCLLLVTPIIFLLRRLYIRRQRELTHEVREQDTQVLSGYQEATQHFLVIKTLRAYEQIRQRLSRTQFALEQKVRQRLLFSVRPFLLMRLGFDLAYLVVFVWGVIGLKNQLITYGALMAYVQLVMRVQSPLKNLSQYVNAVIQGHIAYERVVALESLSPDAYAQDDALHSAASRDFREQILSGSLDVSLSVRGVTYQYAPTSRKVLEDFSCNFLAGSVTAILGETGSGKTTLIRLMLGLITPQTGSVEWGTSDGVSHPYCDFGRDVLAYVPQGNTLLSGTIRENLMLANPEATEEELSAVLHVAAADFVWALPQGLDTPCQEFGGGLSAGQAQRICIARALLRPCPVLVFDESTSALDAETENQVIQRLVAHCKGKTLVFITHRPAVLSYCTQVIHMNSMYKPDAHA